MLTLESVLKIERDGIAEIFRESSLVHRVTTEFMSQSMTSGKGRKQCWISCYLGSYGINTSEGSTLLNARRRKKTL